MAPSVPLSRFTSRVGGGSAFYVSPQYAPAFIHRRSGCRVLHYYVTDESTIHETQRRDDASDAIEDDARPGRVGHEADIRISTGMRRLDGLAHPNGDSHSRFIIHRRCQHLFDWDFRRFRRYW